MRFLIIPIAYIVGSNSPSNQSYIEELPAVAGRAMSKITGNKFLDGLKLVSRVSAVAHGAFRGAHGDTNSHTAGTQMLLRSLFGIHGVSTTAAAILSAMRDGKGRVLPELVWSLGLYGGSWFLSPKLMKLFGLSITKGPDPSTSKVLDSPRPSPGLLPEADSAPSPDAEPERIEEGPSPSSGLLLADTPSSLYEEWGRIDQDWEEALDELEEDSEKQKGNRMDPK
jgi:hypothetical protein